MTATLAQHRTHNALTCAYCDGPIPANTCPYVIEGQAGIVAPGYYCTGSCAVRAWLRQAAARLRRDAFRVSVA